MKGKKNKKMPNPVKPVSKKVGLGTYGCVFRPAFACDVENPKLYVSKVFHTTEHAVKEYREMSVLDEIDPRGEFTLKPYAICVVSKRDMDALQLSMCGADYSAQSFTQIVYPDGRNDLDNYKGSFDALQSGFRTIMDGLQQLQLIGKVHRDIKPGNILFTPSSKKMFLIDFGLMEDEEKQLNDQHFNTYCYQYWPPEYNLAGFTGHEAKSVRSNVSNKRFVNINWNSVLKDHIGKNVLDVNLIRQSFCNKYNIENKWNLPGMLQQEFLAPLLYTKKEMLQKMKGKVDIYGLAVTILIVATQCTVREPEL